MVKISFIASGIILGLATISSASASLISRGFLDEALENYATNTALDLKADKSDFTALSNKIGTLPEGITLENFYKGWVDSGGESMAEYIAKKHGTFYTYDPVNDDVGPVKYPDVGYLDVLASLMDQDGFTPAENSVLAPFYYLTKQAMRVGEIPRGKTAAGMIDDITNYIDLSVENAIAALMGYENGHKIRVKAVLSQLFMPIPEYPNFYNLGWNILNGGAFPTFAQEKYGIPGYKGLVDLTKAVGDLPSGNYPEIPGAKLIYDTYPTSLAESITAIYGNSETGQMGLLEHIIEGFGFDPNGGDQYDLYVGIIPNHLLARDAIDLATTANTTATAAKTVADANTAKIGTLPSGNFPIFPGYQLLFPVFAQSFTYPTSLAELIDAIYGNAESGRHGLLAGIIEGYEVDTNGDGITDSRAGTTPNFILARHAIDLANANTAKIGTVPDGKNLAGMISETDTKIGTLPTEYATVGAALTAMKSDIDAKNLPSTSDDGRYVLSAKKVGDTITYTWVKMDLTNEEQAQ